jgi:hypothetical protein
MLSTQKKPNSRRRFSSWRSSSNPKTLMVGLSLARNTNLVDTSELMNKIVEWDERRSYRI